MRSFLTALSPMVVMLSLLAIQVKYTGDFRPHLPLLGAIAFASFMGILKGYRWHDISRSIFDGISSALSALAIFVLLGILVASWIISGTVPTLVVLGLDLINSQVFLPLTFLISSMIGFMLGSGTSTVGTVGLALAGVGQTIGIPSYITAGAIVSGAFFGNRTSPVSDSTALASSICNVDPSLHVKNMIRSSLVPFILSLVLYSAVGLFISLDHVDLSSINLVRASMEHFFDLSPVTLVPIVLVMILVYKRMAPLPAFFLSILSAILISAFLQGYDLQSIVEALLDGPSFSTGSELTDSVLNRGGLKSVAMLFVMVCMALGLGGVMEGIGFMKIILSGLSSLSKFISLKAITVFTTAIVSISSGSASLGVVLSGKMFNKEGEEANYRYELSRSVVEGSILMVPLVPWAACGAFISSALGLSINDGSGLMYIPFSFYCVLSPVWAMLSK